MNSRKSEFNPWDDQPKTSEEYIKYAELWLSGDAGWRPRDVRNFMEEFRNSVIGELAESGKAPVLKTGDT